jgi:hypothetical protein
MKTLVFALSMFCATGALAQVGAVLSSEPQRLQMPSHPEHASRKPLATEQSILGGTAPTIVRGERPLWELAPVKEELSLGEAARIQRKQHANDRKASMVWHN